MPRKKREQRQPVRSDNDDSVSITSSQPDELNDGAEYEVETILAEKKVPRKGTFFLIRWKDYALEESTWEPESNLGSELMADWLRKQHLQDSGKEPRFDLDDFDLRVKEYNVEKERMAQEKVEKKIRRRQKKKRLGLAVSPSVEPEPRRNPNQQSSSDEAVEQNEIDDFESASRVNPSVRAMPSKRKLGRGTQSSIDSSSEEEPLLKVQRSIQTGVPNRQAVLEPNKPKMVCAHSLTMLLNLQEVLLTKDK